jgi:DNA-binding GntR family transcriptional regulator
MAAAEEATFPERKRGSGVKVVYEMLRDEILDLRLPPGSPIDEVQLADRFAMSRTPRG